jgi:hypothetical protein
MLKSFGVGYIDDFVPREPCPVTSRSVFTISPYNRLMIIKALVVYMSCSTPVNPTGKDGSAIEYAGMLQVMSCYENFAEGPCIRRPF